jgi:DNA helicase-2/ATP-dependent DNA helicase PcrA
LQDHTITDFATDAKLAGKVVVTTLHSSKGRQFDAVVLPGLVEGLVPSRRWNRRDRNYPEPIPASLSEDRRLFYVGFTRARKLVALVSAASYVNQYGYPVELGESRFVGEIRARLGE